MDTGDMILVSVDNHVVEGPSMEGFFQDHLPAKYKDRAPRVIHRDNGTDAWLIDGVEVASFGLNAVMGASLKNGATTPPRSSRSVRAPTTSTSASATWTSTASWPA